MKGKQGILTLAALAASFIVVGCQPSKPNIASVNGEQISQDDFYKYLELKPDVRVVTQNGVATLPVENTLGFQAMQDLIAQKLTIQLAKDKKIFPTDKEITDEIEFQKKLKPNFLVALTQRGLTMEMIRQSLALDLIQEKLITQDIKVTAADVNKYIKDNPRQFVEPARADLSWILVRDARVQKAVDADLARGNDFTQVAQRYSVAPNVRETKGKLIDQSTGGAPAVANLPEAVRTSIANLQNGQTTGWVRFVDGWAKFYLNQKIAEKAVVMSDARKEFLRRLLAKQRGAKARDVNKEVLDKLKDSDVKIVKSSYKEPWERAYEQFKLQNKLEGLTGTRSN